MDQEPRSQGKQWTSICTCISVYAGLTNMIAYDQKL